MDGVGFLKQIFTLYVIPPNSAEIEGNLIFQDTNPAVIELEAVFKGQLGYWWQKSALTNCFISDHINFIIIKTDCASSQTAEVWVFFLLAFFFSPAVQFKQNSFSLSSHILTYFWGKQMLPQPSRTAQPGFEKLLITAVSSHYTKQLPAPTIGKSLLIFKTTAWGSNMDVYASLCSSTLQAGCVVTDSDCKQPESHLQFWQQLLWGCSSSRGKPLDWEHIAALASTPYPGAAQRDDAYPLSLALCHQDIPTQGLAAVAALKLGCTWQKFVPHCSDMHWKLPTETLGEQLCFQCDAVPNKAALALCVQAAAKWLEITPQH